MGCFPLVYNLILRFLRLTSFGTSSQRSRNEVRWVGIGRNRIVGIRESNSTQGAADRATTKAVSSNRRSAADGCTPGVRQSWAIAVYHLPTEAQWEYACRAGSKTIYSFDDEEGLLPEYSWFKRNSSNRTHTVGLLEPNAWGLYNMHGNVWEWCSDWYVEYPKGAVSDSTGPSEGSYRVLRGGSWRFCAADCRSAVRLRRGTSDRSDFFGFRIALSSPLGM